MDYAFPVFFSTLFFLVYLIYIASSKKGSFIDRFTNKITLITGFLAAFGIYLTYKIFQIQSDNISNDITLRLIDRAWMGINKEIASKRNKCPTLVNSLYFPWQKTVLGDNTIDNNTKNNLNDDWTTCSYLSNIIFQSWEDYLTLSSLDETEDQVWVANFVQWASSDILRKNWNVLKGNYSSTTIEFGDYLFRVLTNYTPQNEIEHISLANQIIHSEDFKRIHNKRSQQTVNFF